jgi:hypothetical protein
MADFTILDVFDNDCHMVVKVQHLHDDDAPWHIEYYYFQGREGLKHKRVTDAEGFILMDDGAVAPKRDRPIRQVGEPATLHNQEQYLPSGRDWARHPEPHLDVESILNVIRNQHTARSVDTETIQRQRDDVLIPMKHNEQDTQGYVILVNHFQSLIGRTE